MSFVFGEGRKAKPVGGMSLREIGRELGISKEMVMKHEKDAIRKLREGVQRDPVLSEIVHDMANGVYTPISQCQPSESELNQECERGSN